MTTTPSAMRKQPGRRLPLRRLIIATMVIAGSGWLFSGSGGDVRADGTLVVGERGSSETLNDSQTTRQVGPCWGLFGGSRASGPGT